MKSKIIPPKKSQMNKASLEMKKRGFIGRTSPKPLKMAKPKMKVK